jgi:hypothetical protein
LLWLVVQPHLLKLPEEDLGKKEEQHRWHFFFYCSSWKDEVSRRWKCKASEGFSDAEIQAASSLVQLGQKKIMTRPFRLFWWWHDLWTSSQRFLFLLMVWLKIQYSPYLLHRLRKWTCRYWIFRWCHRSWEGWNWFGCCFWCWRC